jgi:hypothetical protein
LAEEGVEPDQVVVGGPGNSLVEHEVEGNRGFKLERQVTVRQAGQTGRQEWVVRYHMTEPRKISMFERRELVDTWLQ